MEFGLAELNFPDKNKRRRRESVNDNFRGIGPKGEDYRIADTGGLGHSADNCKISVVLGCRGGGHYSSIGRDASFVHV